MNNSVPRNGPTPEQQTLALVQEQFPEAVTFDWAIPYEQFKLINVAAGFNVNGRVVTAYAAQGAYGRIVGLDSETIAAIDKALT